MASIDDYLLGNDVLHARFRVMTEILGKIVSSAPRAVSMAQLESSIGRPANELAKLCTSLKQAALLQPDPSVPNGWKLACNPGDTSLEDVFRCAAAAQRARSKAATARSGNPDRTHYDVDLLMMQATMAINQSVFRHLRQFSLDRLKTRTTVAFPVSQQSIRSLRYDDSLAGAAYC